MGRLMLLTCCLVMLCSCGGSGSEDFDKLFTSVQVSVTEVNPMYLLSDVAIDSDDDQTTTNESCRYTTTTDTIELTLMSKGLSTIKGISPSEVRFDRYRVVWSSADPKNNCEVNLHCKALFLRPHWGSMTLLLSPDSTVNVSIPIVYADWKSLEGGLIDSCSPFRNGSPAYCKYYVTVELYGTEILNNIEKVATAHLSVQFDNYGTGDVAGRCRPN